MENLLSYENWNEINEGGWSTAKTQGTALTPKVIKLIVDQIKIIDSEFNSHLRELELPSLDFSKPIGSGTWWQEDLKNEPNKT